jgi:tRNA (cmo5U34)-methyltransferase
MMNHFDEAARSWDSNPINWERSEAIAYKIKQKIELKPEMTALEFGAGTGILSFLLKDSLKEIILMDNSTEMVRVMEEKVNNEKVSNLKPLCFDLVKSEYDKTFDLIYSQMALHHIADVPQILAKFYRLLNPGGSLAIADLYSEDGSFHSFEFNGHLGFDEEELCEQLEEIGYKNIKQELCFIINRLTGLNEIKEYPVFIITAEK